ncbi:MULTISPECIES: hypothetical protein [unclassified Ruegeria]|uniref:hypothetical protein n=1 Tax=unclassified Ruegeria TaxID=2625375 RepID=UPI00148761E7|nr:MULTISPECIES: hypothetical protein [unclassified Ruegeria]
MRTIVFAWVVAIVTICQSKGSVAQEIDAAKLADGWKLNFFPIQDTNKPDSPNDRSLATLLYKGDFPVDYRVAFDTEPELTKYKDRFWLIEFDGFLDLSEVGPYTFVLSSSEPQWEVSCGAKLEINGNPFLELPTSNRKRGSHNAYIDVQLQPGLYRTKTKIYCIWLQAPNANPKFELAIRGPSDGKPVPVTSNMMKHLRP